MEWLRDVDRNKTFFNVRVAQRRQKVAIVLLNYEDGQCVTLKGELEQIVIRAILI